MNMRILQMKGLQILIQKIAINLFLLVLKSNQHKKRKYYSQYLSRGFTSICDEKAPDIDCIFCYALSANILLAPVTLQRPMETRHSDCKNKDKYLFESKHEALSKL